MDNIIYFIELAIICILAFWTSLLSGRYYLHMFQLNGYNSKEFQKWYRRDKKGIRTNIFLVMGLFLALIVWKEVSPNFGFIVLLLTFTNAIKWFDYFRKKYTKKKLVYTNRVKRIIFTEIVLVLILYLIGIYFLRYETNYVFGILMIILTLTNMASIVVTSDWLNKPMEKRINNGYIKDAKRILKSNENLKIIGVTGSYGKTSVKFYLKTLLEEHFNTLVTPESYNTPMGIVKTIRGYLKPTHEIFVCEMGAKEIGEIKEICDIVNPDWGLITAIGPQHLESFGTLDNIVKTKYELADSLNKDGKLFLNIDDNNIMGNKDNYENIVGYSASNIENKGDGAYGVEDYNVSNQGTDFTLVTKNGEKEHFQMKLVGKHNIINVVGAIAVANQLGVPLKDLKIPVRKLKPAQHRMEIIDRGKTVIIDDAFNSNPVGSKAAVETLGMFDGVKILITPGMVELGEEEYDYNYKFGKYASENCDYIFLVNKERAIPIKKGALDNGFPEEKCKVLDNLQEAMEQANLIKTDSKKYILLENDLTDNY